VALQAMSAVEINLETFASRAEIQSFQAKMAALHAQEYDSDETKRVPPENAIALCLTLLSQHCRFMGIQQKTIKQDSDRIKALTVATVGHVKDANLLHEDRIASMTISKREVEARASDLASDVERLKKELKRMEVALSQKEVDLSQRDVDLIEARLLLQSVIRGRDELSSEHKVAKERHRLQEEGFARERELAKQREEKLANDIAKLHESCAERAQVTVFLALMHELNLQDEISRLYLNTECRPSTRLRNRPRTANKRSSSCDRMRWP
jgi:hypothetical protein